MSKVWNGLQGFNRHDYEAPRLAKLYNEIGEDTDFAYMFIGLQDYSYSTSAK